MEKMTSKSIKRESWDMLNYTQYIIEKVSQKVSAKD
jgi:hypothetical protein